MTDADRLDAVFRLVLASAADQDLETTAYGQTETWDSVGHMELIVGIEAEFGISVDGDDVFAMSDYGSVRRILRDRYGLQLSDR